MSPGSTINTTNISKTGLDQRFLKHDGEAIYIEAKHIEHLPGSIHWSCRQYEKCRKCSDEKKPYFIALLRPGEKGSDKYAIHWIWDPLERLMKLDRKVIWGTTSKPLLQEYHWEIPEPPKLSSFKFKEIEIALAGFEFNSDDQDDSTLKKLEAKLRNAQNLSTLNQNQCSQ